MSDCGLPANVGSMEGLGVCACGEREQAACPGELLRGCALGDKPVHCPAKTGARVRKPLKLPKYTMAPSRDWTENAGLRRAVAVLKAEAAILRREGYDLQPKALMRVAAALTEANRKGSTTGEAYALDWVRRDEATAPAEDA